MTKRLFILALCLALIAACYGCRGTASTAAAPDAPKASVQAKDATWQQHTDPVTLTMISEITRIKEPHDNPIPPDWGEDNVSRLIMSLTGVQLVFVKAGSLDMMLASGEMADLVCLENETEFNRLENGEICYGLDELANTYCPDFWNDVDPLERLNNTASDGHIYTLRGGYNNAAVYEDEKIPISPPWTMNIRTDFLEKLNSPMPTSVEELETLLYTAKASGFTMPYRMRGAAETPLASWMGVKRDLSWDAEAKKVRTPLRDEAWLPYLKMMAKWYRDGVLILPEQEDLLQKDLTRNSGGLEETASIAFVSAIPRQFAYYGSTYLGDLYSQHIGDKDIVSFPFALWMEPLTYHGRVQLQAADQAIANWDNTPGKGWRHRGSTFISRGCSNPERAILFLQFLKSDEGAKIAVWGVPGEQYTLDENDMPLSKEGYQASKRESGDWGISNYPFLYGINYWNFVDNSWVSGTLEGAPVAYVTNKTILTLRQMQIQAGIHYKKYLAKNKNPVFSFAWPKAGTPDDTKLKALQQKWEESILAIITQSADDTAAEDTWNRLCIEMATLGLDTLEDNMTVRFADALKRYQAEGYFTDIQP